MAANLQSVGIVGNFNGTVGNLLIRLVAMRWDLGTSLDRGPGEASELPATLTPQVARVCRELDDTIHALKEHLQRPPLRR